MPVKNVMTIRKNGLEYHYHRYKWYKLARLSSGVDPNDLGAVRADFASLKANIGNNLPPGESNVVLVDGVSAVMRKSLFRCRERAKKIGVDFDIDLPFIAEMARRQSYRCELSGIIFDTRSARDRRANPFRPSIDRIDCSKGYTRDNVRLVLIAVNYGLADFADEIYLEICKSVVKTDAKRRKGS